jgi:hypothetical protein
MDEELDELSALPREIEPPPEWRRAVARRLRRERLLRRSMLPYVAAAVVIAGLFAALLLVRHPSAPQPNYILLLYESENFQGGSRAEYSAWAKQMRPLVVGGEELHDQSLMTIDPIATTPRLAGYFLIHAPDDATAERISRACPHVKHGGGIALRKIVS